MGLSEDLERVALQERELVLPRLDAQVAWELGTRLDAGRGTWAGAGDRRAALRAAALLRGAGRHHSGQCGMGAAQEQRGGALSSQLLRRGDESEAEDT